MRLEFRSLTGIINMFVAADRLLVSRFVFAGPPLFVLTGAPLLLENRSTRWVHFRTIRGDE
jgi:hypothetical protein